jgi:hypothetical protein
MNYQLLSSIILFSLIAGKITGVQAQETFDWIDGTCLYSGKIDSTKTTNEEISNAYYSVKAPTELSQPFLPYKPADTSFISITALTKERDAFLSDYTKMNFPDSPFWQELKQAKINEILELANLRILCAKALNNPKTLKKSHFYKSQKKLCNVLIKGGDELLNAWKELQAEEFAEAKNPEIVQASFQAMWDSPLREWYARLELLRYVFYNNAKSEISFVIYNPDFDVNFNGLFVSVNKQCH